MEMMKKIAVIALAGVLPLSAYAQQDSTLNRTVVVENEYNPTVMDASKINVLPKVEEPAVVKKGIEYATALRPVVSMSYEEMSPMVREGVTERAERGYVRGGYGNYGNVDVKAGYVWDITSRDRLQVAASLDGWNGTFKDTEDQDWKSRFYSSAFRLGYRHSFRKVDLNLGGFANSQVFNYMDYYGPDGTPSEGKDRQNHLLGDFRVGVASTDEGLPLKFVLETGFNYFKQRYPTVISGGEMAGTEKKIHTVGDVWGKLGDVQRVGIQFAMDNLFYSGSQMEDYTSLCLNPYYALDRDNFRLRLGAHVDWLTGGKDDGIDIAPDVKMEFVFSDSYVFYVHALGGRELNDYRRLNGVSPYWALPGQLAATYVPVNASAGLKGSPMSGLWFNVFGGYQIRENELFSYLSAGQFSYTAFAQDKGKIGYGGAEVKYGHKGCFDASLKGTYYGWKTENEAEGAPLLAAMKPELELNFRTDVNVFEGLKVNLGYDYVKRKGEGIDPVSNLYVGADYEFLKGLSIFADVNNLLNKRYYLDSCYPAEKLNVLAGLSYRF